MDKIKTAIETLSAAADKFDSLARQTPAPGNIVFHEYAQRMRDCIEKINNG